MPATPGARMEAIISQPLRLTAVGKAPSHAGQTPMDSQPVHAQALSVRTTPPILSSAARACR